MSDVEATPYGFMWGENIEVQRMATFDSPRGPGDRVLRVLGVITPSKLLEIHVSPTGSSVRCYLHKLDRAGNTLGEPVELKDSS